MANKNPNTSGLKSIQQGTVLNPNGRPKYKFIKDIFNVLLNEEVNVKDSNTGEAMRLNRAELMAMSQVKKAVNGDTRAFQAVIDRIEGRPIERLSVTTTYEDQLLALSDEEKSEVYKELQLLKKEHGITDTVDLEDYEILQADYEALKIKVVHLEARHNEQLEKLRLNGLD